MIERKAYRFRLYPTSEQETLFRRTAGCRRLVYNLCLEQKTLERHRSEPRRLSAYDQQAELKALKQELPFLRDVPHHALQQAIVDLHKGFRNFFEGRADFPRFCKKDQGDAFRYPDPKQFRFEGPADAAVVKGKGATADNRTKMFLPKAGWVEVARHRPVLGAIRNATVSRVAGAWFVSVQTEREVTDVLPNGKPSVGIDGGIECPIVLSDGTMIALPRISEREWRALAALQKKLARQRKGSRSRERTKRKVANLQARFARRRKDAAEKASTWLVKNHGLIVSENLKLKNMTRSARGSVEEPGRNVRQKAGLNRSFADVGLGQVYATIDRKAAAFGCVHVRVDPAYTSQRCSQCEHVDAENRPSRSVFRCVACGHEAHADQNAAETILRKGLDLFERETPLAA